MIGTAGAPRSAAAERPRLLRILAVLLIAANLTGCASGWQVAGHKVRSMKGRYSVEVPQGWMYLRQENGDRLFSQHGPQLQNFHVDRQRASERFDFTNRMIDTGMAVQDLAQVVIDNSLLTPGIGDLRVTELGPAVVDGLDAFRAVIDFRVMPGIRRRAILYGLLAGRWYYELTYVAATRHYFELDANTFERFVSSFRFFNGFRRRAARSR